VALKVSEVMSTDPVRLAPTATLSEAARKMADYDIGDVLVVQDQRLHGVVTDRDIVIRALAEGLDPNLSAVGQICSPSPVCVAPADPITHAVELMRDKALRRLPVCEGDRLVGIVSLGDLAISQDAHSTLADISAAPPNH
jgi:CBS domain-containing protein